MHPEARAISSSSAVTRRFLLQGLAALAGLRHVGNADAQALALQPLEAAPGIYVVIADLGPPSHANEGLNANLGFVVGRDSNRQVTTGQILVFGLTGGLIQCPAPITVLLLCLQLKQFTLGAALALCFSVGLALTMVASGAMAALSVKHVPKRWSEFARRAPYFSGALILLVGLYLGYQDVSALA